MLKAFQAAEKLKKPNPEEMFKDVYKEMTPHLTEQLADMKKHVRQYEEHYPLGQFEKMDN